jgi:site-specific DNA-cytosine methylase
MARILIACEESQATTKEFRKLGHEAFSCDLLPCSGGHPEWHIQGDVLEHLNKDWDLIIAHPPCTHLSSSGQWAFTKGIKDTKLREDAVDFFMTIANSNCQRIAIENPIGIMSTRWRKPDQIIQPWHFGDLASKSTCLWLKGLPKLVPIITEKPEMDYHTWIDKKTGATKRMERWMYDIRTKPHKMRSGLASKTFDGTAKAFAEQWGGIF